MLIEVIDSPGCAKCKKAREVVQKVVPQYKGVEYKVLHVLKDMERIVELGTLTTPTIAIDGEIVFTGTPKEEVLKKKIEEYLEKEK